MDLTIDKNVFVCTKCGTFSRRGYAISTDIKKMMKDMYKQLLDLDYPDGYFITGSFNIIMQKGECKKCYRERKKNTKNEFNYSELKKQEEQEEEEEREREKYWKKKFSECFAIHSERGDFDYCEPCAMKHECWSRAGKQETTANNEITEEE